MWPLHTSWIMLTLVTTTNTQIHANYVHLTSPQQWVKYTDFSKSKFMSYDPWKQTPEHTHIATIAISLCVRSIRTSSISYSLTHATAALHSALPPQQWWNISLYVQYIHSSIHKLLLTHVIAALHSAFMCITLQSLNVNTHILGIHCHKLQQFIYIQYNVNASHQNTHKCISSQSHIHVITRVVFQ